MTRITRSEIRDDLRYQEALARVLGIAATGVALSLAGCAIGWALVVWMAA
jgi:hypothetical protein